MENYDDYVIDVKNKNDVYRFLVFTVNNAVV